MERAPVSLRRLTYRDDGMVHYQGTKIHPRLGRDHQLLPALDFLSSLVPHILLRYEVTIRSYGALSTTFRKNLGWIEKPPVHEPPPRAKPVSDPQLPEADGPPLPLPSFPSFPPPIAKASTVLHPQEEKSEFERTRRRNWARLISKVWRTDPEICSTCGKRMRIVAAISHPAQDTVIERILRHLHLWDPPWKRPRKARGPPPPTSGSQGSESGPPAEDWPEAIDPPHPEDDLDPPFEDK